MSNGVVPAGMGKLVDVVEPNKLMSFGVIGFLGLVAVAAIFTGGFAVMSLVLAACAIGMGIVVFMQMNQYKIEIYENGMIVSGGLMTQSGTFLYSAIENVYGEKSVYKLAGMIPVFHYTTITVSGRNDQLLTQLSSFTFADLEKKLEYVENKVS